MSNLASRKNVRLSVVAVPFTREAARADRLACAVAELRQSIWDEISHIARCWKLDPRELVEASRERD
jgi:hypothetical protein